MRSSSTPTPETSSLAHRIRSLTAAQRQLLEERLGDLEVSLAFFDQQQESRLQPRNEIESQLADIWQQVLGLDAVGVEDNFFDLGGDSILSIRIVAKAHRQGLKLTSKQLFEHPTIAELAQRVELVPVAAPGAGSSGPQRDVAKLPARQLAPEDFPEAELSRDDLNRILDKIQSRQQSRHDVRKLVIFGSDRGDGVQVLQVPSAAALSSAG